MTEIDTVLKMKRDLYHYTQLAARLEKRVEILERKENGGVKPLYVD